MVQYTYIGSSNFVPEINQEKGFRIGWPTGLSRCTRATRMQRISLLLTHRKTTTRIV